jgi:hypothetical protein
MKFLEMFTPISKGNFGLTEMAIYKSIDKDGNFIPIWGGNKEHNTIDRMVSEFALTKSGKKISIFHGEGIVISLDGSAGSMTYKNDNKKFALNHHAGFFKVKDEIDMEFFSIFYQSQLKELSVSEGSKTLTLNQIYNFDFEIPEHDIQLKIMKSIKPMLTIKSKIESFIEKIEKIKTTVLSENYSKFQGMLIPIGDIIECISGNSGLTKQFLYSQIQHSEEKKYIILTGSVDYSLNQRIHRCQHPFNSEKLISVVDNKSVIHVIRKGKAGTTAYFPDGNYTTNDDAYLLCVRDDSKFKINLEWLMYVLKSNFLEYASSSDNGTWNMTGFFKNVTVDLPIIEEQLRVAKEFQRLNSLENKLIRVLDKINNLLCKHIATE